MELWDLTHTELSDASAHLMLGGATGGVVHRRCPGCALPDRGTAPVRVREQLAAARAVALGEDKRRTGAHS